MRIAVRTLIALAVIAATTQLSCSVNDYCLNCATTDDGGNGGGDGGPDDGGNGDDAFTDGGCLPTGPEECDGKDNDCNGLIDDGVLPYVGDPCPNQMGECAGAAYECVGGELKCDKVPSPEVCNGLDDNCDGVVDDGDPGGGAKCGTEMGECVAGQMRCNTTTGMLECVGGIGPAAEICDAKDNDCDGNFDENIGSLGTCGPATDDGLCEIGTLICQAGSPVCMGAVFPKFETCNGFDDDCDNKVDEIFATQTDPANCGMCGNKCQPASKTCINSPVAGVNGDTCTADADCQGGSCVVNSQPRCVMGGCTFSCNAGFHNQNGVASDGCEYRCFATGSEVCDGADNDCDGVVDEDLDPPEICLSGGECGATAPEAECTGSGGWTCTYPGDVQFPETRCDGKDNDCDINVDEGQPNLGAACDNGAYGACRTTGTFVCDTSNLDGPAVCDAPPSSVQPSPEACDDQDNDCDNLIDEGASTGNLIGQEWVDIGGGKQMMKYEASRPDATATSSGTRSTFACSKPNALPWTNVTYPQAVAACAAIGATLCGELTWHRACSNVAGNTFPISVGGSSSGYLIEAEDYSGIGHATSGGVTRSWVPDYTPGFSGIAALEATPNSGGSVSQANAPTQAPYVEYQINFTQTGTYRIWVRMFSNKGSDDQIHVAVSGVATMRSQTTDDHLEWEWRNTGTFDISTTGVRTVRVYMGDDGVKIDQLFFRRNSNTAPSNTINSKGNKWAFASNPNNYAMNTTTCNGDDLDTSPAPGDQDDILPTGSLPNCRSTIGTGVFDMSGNVKEWTLAHQPGENPIRGGASNNTGEGISCPLNFTLADDAFFFPNIGFRCCR